MEFLKKWLSVMLTAVLTLSLLTPALPTYAQQSEEVQLAEQQEIAIQLEIIGLDKTIIELATKNIQQGTTAIDVVKEALHTASIPYEIVDSEYGPYIQSINGVASGKLGGWDGWMYSVNGQSLEVGLGEYTLVEGDVLKVYYSKYPKLTATAAENKGQQTVTLQLVGDHFAPDAVVKAAENWELPSDVVLQNVIRYTNQKVTLKIQASPGTYTVKALASILTSGQETEITFELKDAVAETIRLIAALPTIEEASETNKLALKAAREAFDALTEQQQALVTNINELIEKENLFKTLNAVTIHVNVRIEGIKDTVLNKKNIAVTGDGEVNAAVATIQVLDANDIPYDYRSTSGYFKSINGDDERALGDGSGWMYKVNGVYPDVYANAHVLQEGDEIVWEYINSFSLRENLDFSEYGWDFIMYSGADTVDLVTFNPIIDMPETAQAGEDITIKVTGQYNTLSYYYEKLSGPTTVALEDVSIAYNGKVYKTEKYEELINDETVVYGKAVIPATDVVPGTFELRFTKDLPGTIKDAEGNDKVLESFPRILRTYKTLQVNEAPKDNRKLAEDALALGKQYLKTNPELVSNRVNESSSGFWMLTALNATGVDVASYPWTTAPTSAGTFWTTMLEEPLTTADQKLGSIIAATALGLDPTNLKGRNQVADLLAGKNAANLMATIYSEPLALIALDLANADYDKAAHIAAILNLQNETTGIWSNNMDITGWALFALAPYKDQPAVKAAIDQAVDALYNNYHQKGFTNNANTMAAIISGLASVGEDVFSDKWTYVKDGKQINIVGHLIENYIFEDGGVRFLVSQKTSSLMAVEQVYVALFDALNNKSTFSTLNEGKTPAPTTPGENTGGTTSPEQPAPVPTTDQVTMSITISASEVVLPSEQFNIVADETAFDLLKRVTQAKNIALNARQTSMGMYVAGIAGVNEFDRGKLSGWMYSVNGTYPSVSANEYVLKNGDVIQWTYTTDLGNDVGAPATGNATEAPEKTEQKPEETVSNEFTTEQLQGKAQVVIQDESGVDVTIPTAGVQLDDQQKLVVDVKTDKEQLEVTLTIVAQDGTTTALNTGKHYVKVTVPVQEGVIVQLVDGKYRAVPHTIVDGKATILTKTSGVFTVSQQQVTFNDVDNVFSKEEIEFLANRYVVLGANGAFMPHENLTRGQFAMMIARALGLQATNDNPFSDTVGKEYEKDVQALFEAGITTGKTATTFDPTATITREQAAAFMARVFDYMGIQAQVDAAANYKDAEAISKTYADAIALLAQYGIMNGKADGTFDPKGNLTRAEMAKIFKRTLNQAGLM